MKLKTSAFGVQEYDEQAVLKLLEGMLGFSRLNRYILIEKSDLRPFQWLQSVDNRELAFLVVDPHVLISDYARMIPALELERLEIEHPSDMLALVVVVIQENPEESSVNLKAPLIINHRRMIGRQIILTESPYGMRTPLQSVQRRPDESIHQCST